MKLLLGLLAIAFGTALALFCAQCIVTNNLVRAGLVLGAAIVAAGLGYLTLSLRVIRRPILGSTLLLAAAVAIVPVRTPSAELQSATLQEAMRYLGAPYSWGGESVRGIDCSGLPRAAQRNAALRLLLENRDPGLLRVFVLNWLIDVPAKGMVAGRGTEVVGMAKSMSELPNGTRVGGNLIATADGTHVMMVVDEGHVIEADPAIGRVVTLDISDASSPWTARPVVALRPHPY